MKMDASVGVYLKNAKVLGSEGVNILILGVVVATRVVGVWPMVVEGGWKTLCIKIGYSKPTRAESREGSSTLAKSSRVT